MGLGHAGIAVSGLVLLVWYNFHERVHHPFYNEAAILFVITLTGGLLLLALHEGHKPPPMIVVGLHAVIALAALSLLVTGYIHR